MFRPTAIFLGVTFGISWGLPALYGLLGGGAGKAFGIVHLISVLGPAVGGIAAASSCGRKALSRHLGFLTQFAVGWRWYVGTLAVVAIGYALVVAWSGLLDGRLNLGPWSYWTLLVFLPPPLSDGGPFEELGFRGWLLPSLQSHLPPWIAVFLVSV
ncbi:MAG: hypothetical protein MJA83_19750, partial [Gammaproteobacteria bacterium]|nr:hypothetical protein [Gammaproteobacteria bacterium]